MRPAPALSETSSVATGVPQLDRTGTAGGQRRRAYHRRRRPTTAQILGVAAIAGAGAVLAVLGADGAPSGSAIADAGWRAAVVAGSAVAGSRTRRWALLTSSAAVSIGAAGWMWIAGVTALAIGLRLAWTGRRNRVLGAVAGGLVGLTSLHLGWPPFTYGPTVLATVALVPLLLSAFRTCNRRERRWMRWSLAATAAVSLAAVAGALLLAISVRTDLLDAMSSSRDAVTALQDLSQGSAASSFRSAERRFSSVAERAGSWWTTPARIFPVIGPNVEALRRASSVSADLNGAAYRSASEVDLDAVRSEGGGVDLVSLSALRAPLKDMTARLDAANESLRDAYSPWVVGPVQDRMRELQGFVGTSLEGSRTALLAADHLPRMLGSEEPRRYLLLLGNPAEARDLGGHIGYFAEIIAEQGTLTAGRVNTPYQLFGPTTTPAPRLADPGDFPPSLIEMNPTRFPQNWGANLDLPTVGRLASELYPQATGGATIDGVLYADPMAFAALLELTGEVQVPGSGVRLSPRNAVPFLTLGQFVQYGEDGDESVAQAIRLAIAALLDRKLPSPSQLVETFGPLVEQGHLQFAPVRNDELQMARHLGMSGEIGPIGNGDFLAVINRNANPSKMDQFLEREVDYRLRWNPADGTVDSEVVVRLRNTTPDGPLPDVVANPAPGNPPGSNRTQLSVLTPLRAMRATVDGNSVGVGTQVEQGRLLRHSLVVDLPPGAARTVTVRLEGTISTDEYRLRWVPQPLLTPTVARLRIESTGRPFAGQQQGGTWDLPNRRTDLLIRTAT